MIKCICLLLLPSLVLSQGTTPGQLYVKAIDPSSIPRIIITDTDTLIEIENATLESILQQHHVYSFTRSFPIVDSFNVNNKYGLDHVYTMSCDCDEESLMDDIINGYGSNVFEYIERIPLSTLIYTPDDYHTLDQIPLVGPTGYIAAGGDSALNLINAQTAWNYTHGDTSIKIGIVDAKILLPTHEDIEGQVVYWDTTGGDATCFHGLFVAGCAAAITDNNVGKSGIGFNCKIMTSSHAIGTIIGYQSLLKLSLLGAKVLNASWGSYLYIHGPTITHQQIINLITENGSLLVAGAGNEHPTDYFYPASYANVLSVTAVGMTDHHVSWIPTIPNTHYTSNDSVDICAPGYNVVGLWDSCVNCYKRSSGTSFASPIVAGTAALIFSINPCLSPQKVTEILKSTAYDIYQIPENQQFMGKLGAGRLDAGAAAQLADDCYRPRNYTIQSGQNITWLTDKTINEELVIDSGGILTIKATVYFNPYAKISIKRGGKLIVDGGILTSNCTCTMWSGIDVWGSRSESQYYASQQGTIELRNGALIENAITAIRTSRPDPKDDDPWAYEINYTGGIIKASNSIFRNNQRAILMLPYENFNPLTEEIISNYSYFSGCTFVTTDELSDNSKIPTTFVQLNGIRGIRFSGCIFRNTRSYSSSKYELGKGITSLNSTYYVQEKCLDEYQPCVHEQPSVFEKLAYGIYALGSEAGRFISVDKSCFLNNFTGIYLSSVHDAVITRDTFLVLGGNYSSTDTSGGVYLNECHNYTIEENVFSSNYAYGVLAKSIGLVINNSNLGNYLETDNNIYNNRFEKLRYAVLAMNKNRDNNYGDYGLSIICNDFIYPNEYDISVTKESGSNMGIKFSQGSGGSSSTDPAGNTFSYTWNTTGLLYSDYYNAGENIDYWYHYYGNGYNVKPEHHSPIPIVFPKFHSPNYLTYNKNASCPSSFSGGGGGGVEDLWGDLEDSRSQMDSLSGLLSLLVDGGDTPGTQEYVETSTSNQTLEVRNDLLMKTPYLSDSVMIISASKEEVLPPAIITEVLAANPQAAKSDTVMQILENRLTPLSEEQLATIEDGLFVLGAKESLETKLAGARSGYANALKGIIRCYKSDSIHSWATDSIQWYLQQDEGLWSQYALAFEQLEQKDTTAASTTLNNILSSFSLTAEQLQEHERYQSFFNLKKQLIKNGKYIGEVDSIQTQILIGLASTNHSQVAGYARNVLIFTGAQSYHEPYVFPDPNLKSSRIRRLHQHAKAESSSLKLFPNPAKEYIIVEYQLSGDPMQTSIDVVDLKGITVHSIRGLTNFHDWLVIPVTELPSGMYTVVLYEKGKKPETRKFTIVR